MTEKTTEANDGLGGALCSPCCGAKVQVVGDYFEGTRWHQCTLCLKDCDPIQVRQPVRVDVFGWFGEAAQTEPEHDPGFDAPCPICIHAVGRHSEDNPIKTISLMVEDPKKRRNSFFFRAHKRCWEMVSDHERNMVESSLIDHIVDADKMVSHEHHFRDTAQMVNPITANDLGQVVPGTKPTDGKS